MPMVMSVIAKADKFKLRKRHNELAVLQTAFERRPYHPRPSRGYYLAALPTSDSVMAQARVNRCLGSNSRSLGDILFPNFLQPLGS